jgi:hypothetical protein
MVTKPYIKAGDGVELAMVETIFNTFNYYSFIVYYSSVACDVIQPPCWWTRTKDFSLASFVYGTNMLDHHVFVFTFSWE